MFGKTWHRLGTMLLGLMALAATPAYAQGVEIFSAETIAMTGDARIVAADGDRGWLAGGLGKTRFDSEDGALQVRPEAAEANLIWQPRLGWEVTGTVVAIAQHGQEHPVDLSQASLTYKPMLRGPLRLSVRAGLYWPEISLEHAGPEWRVAETITPSAINSWVGDEIKTGGIEATITAPLSRHRVTATLGAFALNDTSGTLIAFRGWALHDQKATAFGKQKLPPLDAFMQDAQAIATRPVIEIDHKPGWYARIGWSPVHAFELQAFHYDNRGDPEAVTPTLQWGWQTRFDNVGAVVALDRLTLKAQAMAGRTEMGFPMGERLWVDTRFRAAFLLGTVDLGRGSASVRLDAFGTRSRGSVLDGRYSEDGWAATVAGRRELGPHLSLLAELLHVDSRRADRSALSLPARRPQNQFQLALRVHI